MIVRFDQRLRSFASHQKRGNNQMAILERLLWKYYSSEETNEKDVLYLQSLAGWRTHSQQMRRLRPSSSITLQENGGGKRGKAFSCCTSGHQIIYQPVLYALQMHRQLLPCCATRDPDPLAGACSSHGRAHLRPTMYSDTPHDDRLKSL
jgi:hypothetical protein